MKYVIEIPEEKHKAFVQILEGLVDAGVIDAFEQVQEDNTRQTKFQFDTKEKAIEEMTTFYTEQYRDLVD